MIKGGEEHKGWPHEHPGRWQAELSVTSGDTTLKVELARYFDKFNEMKAPGHLSVSIRDGDGEVISQDFYSSGGSKLKVAGKVSKSDLNTLNTLLRKTLPQNLDGLLESVKDSEMKAASAPAIDRALEKLG